MDIAFEEFLPPALLREPQRRQWQDGDPPLPALYVSHGAPPLFEDAGWIDELSRWADRLPSPRGILIVSAHWEVAPLSLSAPAPHNLVYDFGGFDPRYYRMRYDTPDATALADDVVAALSGVNVHRHTERGLDHGAWVPLKVMYPAARIPVLQLSLPTQDPGRLLQLGRRLESLRADGILVIGSGFMTHGLPYLTPEMFYGNAVPTWSQEFDLWAAQALAAGDLDELAAYGSRAPGMPFAHPTVEHFTPLFVTLGAAAGQMETAIEGYAFGLSKRSLQVA
ncbi:MAG: class III extradiol ring-cleavage dioxygenase [Candidatus Nanopelagicales bacterium]